MHYFKLLKLAIRSSFQGLPHIRNL